MSAQMRLKRFLFTPRRVVAATFRILSMLGCELLVVFERTLEQCQPLSNAINGRPNRSRHQVDNLLRSELFQFPDRFHTQKFEHLPALVIIVEKHVKLFFLCHQRASQ